MNLNRIIAKPELYQFRDLPYSEKTVGAIVAEGINPAKFDPLPIVQLDAGLWCIGGDGHSRFEAIKRLAKANRLPMAWRVGNVWEIPCRQVKPDEAQRLAWTANLSRDNFSPCEEAKVFQAMEKTGMDLADIARQVQRSEAYVRKTLALNCLCSDIKAAIGLSPDAGGIDKHIAQAMAEKFQQYNVTPAQQQELWHRVLKHGNLTAKFVRALIDKIGGGLSERQVDGFLFAIPKSVTSAVKDMKDRAEMLRRAERGLQWLMQCKDSGVIDDLPQLRRLLDKRGNAMLTKLQAKTAEDAEVIGSLCIAA